MTNAFKQIRLTNVNLSGNAGRIEAGASGSFAFTSELEADILQLSGGMDYEISGLRDDIYDLNTGLSDLIYGIESGLESGFATGIETLSGFLEGRITEEIENVQTGLFDPLNDRVDELSGAFTGKFAEIETNYLDKRFGGIINADLTVSGMLYASGGLTIDAAGGMDAVLFVENGKVGINTETPSEALEVSGNGKFSGTVRVADPTNGQHATTKTYVDDLFAKRKSFTTGVAPNVESMTVEFPGSPFSSAPTVNVTMEGDVYYAFAISDRTTTGFHISFSDQVLESNIVLNVSASNQ